VSALAIVSEGLLGLVHRHLEQQRMARLAREAIGLHIMMTGRLPGPADLAAACAPNYTRLVHRVRQRIVRAHRVYLIGFRLGRWWRDPDARVFAVCLVLLCVWVVAR
jgi:hypothetical protein